MDFRLQLLLVSKSNGMLQTYHMQITCTEVSVAHCCPHALHCGKVLTICAVPPTFPIDPPPLPAPTAPPPPPPEAPQAPSPSPASPFLVMLYPHSLCTTFHTNILGLPVQ